jgi:hypothetical protein
MHWFCCMLKYWYRCGISYWDVCIRPISLLACRPYMLLRMLTRTWRLCRWHTSASEFRGRGRSVHKHRLRISILKVRHANLLYVMLRWNVLNSLHWGDSFNNGSCPNFLNFYCRWMRNSCCMNCASGGHSRGSMLWCTCDHFLVVCRFMLCDNVLNQFLRVVV